MSCPRHTVEEALLALSVVPPDLEHPAVHEVLSGRIGTKEDYEKVKETRDMLIRVMRYCDTFRTK